MLVAVTYIVFELREVMKVTSLSRILYFLETLEALLFVLCKWILYLQHNKGESEVCEQLNCDPTCHLWGQFCFLPKLIMIYLATLLVYHISSPVSYRATQCVGEIIYIPWYTSVDFTVNVGEKLWWRSVEFTVQYANFLPKCHRPCNTGLMNHGRHWKYHRGPAERPKPRISSMLLLLANFVPQTGFWKHPMYDVFGKTKIEKRLLNSSWEMRHNF